MDEIERDLDSGLAECVAEDLVKLEHLLERHAAFADYEQEQSALLISARVSCPDASE